MSSSKIPIPSARPTVYLPRAYLPRAPQPTNLPSSNSPTPPTQQSTNPEMPSTVRQPTSSNSAPAQQPERSPLSPRDSLKSYGSVELNKDDEVGLKVIIRRNEDLLMIYTPLIFASLCLIQPEFTFFVAIPCVPIYIYASGFKVYKGIHLRKKLPAFVLEGALIQGFLVVLFTGVSIYSEKTTTFTDGYVIDPALVLKLFFGLIVLAFFINVVIGLGILTSSTTKLSDDLEAEASGPASSEVGSDMSLHSFQREQTPLWVHQLLTSINENQATLIQELKEMHTKQSQELKKLIQEQTKQLKEMHTKQSQELKKLIQEQTKQLKEMHTKQSQELKNQASETKLLQEDLRKKLKEILDIVKS